MHVSEGRPLFIIVTGRIYVGEGGDEEHEMMVNNVFGKLTRGVVSGGARVVFEDDTGGVYEVPGGIVTVASKSYLLVGRGRRSIPVILVVQDLLYPFRRPEAVTSEIQRGVKLLEKLIKRALPQDYASRTRLVVVDARIADAPFSLDQIESVPER